ncbi:hypothetical protein F4820DRAFT_418559 [Hypoxylon rubiginosum]|uniref:Uncharacterized protein n=1 Tax=Hypoxylon rubiginosum TaxID=110542 RepID=A0ACB9Z2R5_9PEZI|nr:hypothetical protein F4820DRAFT_418559 [Hypoxylon rubiginosum]
MESMKSLSISEVPSLTALPAEIFHIVLSHLDTARSVSHLALTCKGLHRLISDCGWRIFITSRFNTFSLPEISSQDEWVERARALTSQSRDWDRRAFTLDLLKPPAKQHTRIHNRSNPPQSIASNILVDAHHQRKGNDAQDLIFWGAGEDIFGLVRHTRGSKAPTDEWLDCSGSSAGYRSGRDDVTCVSILKDAKYKYGKGDDPQVLVGRANGELDILSMGPGDFGKKLLRFRGINRESHTPYENTTLPTQIQSFDVNYQRGLLAAGTKQSILLYHLAGAEQNGSIVANMDDTDTIKAPPDFVDEAWADKAISLKEELQGPYSFEFIRSVKFVNESTLAVGLNKCGNPLQYLECTERGFEKAAVAKMSSSDHTFDNYTFRTVRAILPVNTSSLASGGGNAVLSSWDDGTIRLQDLRTPSHIDKVFQDNFDLTTPINSLLSYGLERFVAGSAYSPVLKIFDYRWPKGYYHTESLPCGNNRPYPTPRPPTIVTEPYFPDDRSICDHVAGRSCRWHALSRHDFYRPNTTLYIPVFSVTETSPVYSLASPSDDSPSLFAGLSGRLMEMTAKSSSASIDRRPAAAATATATATATRHIAVDRRGSGTDGNNQQGQSSNNNNSMYRRARHQVAFLETGSGFPVEDVAQAQRVPRMHRQAFVREGRGKIKGKGLGRLPGGTSRWQTRHRFDEWLQEVPGDRE